GGACRTAAARSCRPARVRKIVPECRPQALTTQKPAPYHCGRAQVAELVDALVSGTSAARRGGSSPLLGTSHLLDRVRKGPPGAKNQQLSNQNCPRTKLPGELS